MGAVARVGWQWGWREGGLRHPGEHKLTTLKTINMRLYFGASDLGHKRSPGPHAMLSFLEVTYTRSFPLFPSIP